ncbi:MAG: tetratricopeptide repeat protein, partial [Caldilineaceae bacterium]|nr:tetratricopeptide repeat protein [Caldilineaceae bacterium]
MTRLTISLFGPPTVMVGEIKCQCEQRRPIALLALLAVEEKPFTRAQLATFFWPESPRNLAVLRNNLLLLRKALGNEWSTWVAMDRETVAWRKAPNTEVDVTAFATHLSRVRAHCRTGPELCPSCQNHVQQAVALYQGDFLAGFTLGSSPDFDDWCVVTGERLRREFAGALDMLTDHSVATGAHEAALTYAQHRLALDELDEAAHRRLMLLYHAQGQRGLALRQYDECAALLTREFGVSPAPETDAVLAQVKQGHPASPSSRALQAGSGTGRTSPRRPVHHAKLPAPAMELVGRTQELEHVTRLLTFVGARLVTLTGTGGVGKTRLAVDIAVKLAPSFRDGVYWVELVAQRDPDSVAHVIAATLDIDAGRTSATEELLWTALGEREILLVLDNFEHLLAGAPLVTRLLQRCPALKVLATSRERLNLAGEHEFCVAPLSCPVPGKTMSLAMVQASDAVELFRRHAVATQHQFRLDATNAPIIAQICARLDGLPLAIELAAARIRYHTVASLADRLTRSLDATDIGHTSLDLLITHRRDAEARQRSLRATIDWSYQLLSAREQMLLRRVAVFPGGWTRESAQAVCERDMEDDIEALFYSLLDKHLIRLSHMTAGGPRFSMLETLRSFSYEMLVSADEVQATEQAAAQYFLDLAERIERNIHTAQFTALQERVEAERANMQWSVRRALERRDVPLALRLCGSVFLRWSETPSESAAMSAEILDMAEGAWPSDDYAAALTNGAYWAWIAGDYSQAEPWARQGLEMYMLPTIKPAPPKPGICRVILGLVAFDRADYSKALAYFEENRRANHAQKQDWGLAMTLISLGDLSSRLGRFHEAEAYLREGLELQRQVGQQWSLAQAFGKLVMHHLRYGNIDAAALYLRGQAKVLDDDAQPDRIVDYAYNCALIALHQEGMIKAVQHLHRSLGILQRLGTRNTLMTNLALAAKLALALDRPDAA